MSCNTTSLPPRFHMPSSHTSSMTIPLSPFIPLHPSSTRCCRNSRNQDSGEGGGGTVPTTAQRSYNHVAVLKHNHNNNGYNNNNTVSTTRTQEKCIFSPLQQKWHFLPQFIIQLSRILFFILFFCNLFEQNLFKFCEDH